MRVETRIALPILLYALPLIGAGVVLGITDLVVPRDQVWAEAALTNVSTGIVTFGADVMAAFYYTSAAGAFSFVACAASLTWCLIWIVRFGYPTLNPQERVLFWFGLAFAIGFPLIVLTVQYWHWYWSSSSLCNRTGIDDCVTGILFNLTIKRVYHARFAFSMDTNVLACLVFVTYLISTLTVTLVVPRRGEDQSSLRLDDRARALNTILFLTTAVLIAAMLTVKLRFDIGLATLGPPLIDKVANPPSIAYQTVAAAIMTFWATFLSVCLALIYLPGAYFLLVRASSEPTDPGKRPFIPIEMNVIQVLKIAAIFSPPIINKMVEIISAAPKGV